MEDITSDRRKFSNAAAIELIDVTVHLGNKTVLRSINLSVDQGGM